MTGKFDKKKSQKIKIRIRISILIFFSGIFVFVALVCTFYHANSVVTREVSRNGRRASWPLLIVMINLTACIGLIYFVFEDQKLYEWYIFQKQFFFIKFIDFIISVLFLCGSVPSLVSQSFYGLLESTILYSNSSVSLSKLELFWCPRMFCNIEKG